MATYTSYLNLEKPTTSETFNLLKMNQNWDKIDAGVSALNSNLATKIDYQTLSVEANGSLTVTRKAQVCLIYGVQLGNASAILDVYNRFNDAIRHIGSNTSCTYSSTTTELIINNSATSTVILNVLC